MSVLSRILVDTNILLRAIQRDSPFCQPSRNALKQLHRREIELCLTPQNVKEFWNACTRPTDKNGLGLSIAGAERHTQRMEQFFTILPDSFAAYSIWRQLLTEHDIMGAKVHDAYLVATMKANSIKQVLTFNTSDFARYGDISVVDPKSL